MLLNVDIRNLLRETLCICIAIIISIVQHCFSLVLHICSFKDKLEKETLGGICEK